MSGETPDDRNPKDSLLRLKEARQAVTAKRLRWEDLKVQVKEAREELKEAQVHLDRLIDDETGLKPLPLFDEKAEAEDKPPPRLARPADAFGVAWKAESLAKLEPYGLTDKLVDHLNDAGMFTLGHLSDWTSSGKELTDIGGIGPAKAEKIADAFAAFWRDYEPPERADFGGDDAGAA